MIADEFNHYFASVGSSTALAAEKLAKDYNLQLTNPLTRTNIHPIPTSMLIPLLKEGDHETPNNNHPLSLLVTVSKIIEKIVSKQFNSYLISKQRLTSHQSGNKKYHSTETHNVAVTDEILEAMDKKCCRRWFY